MAEVFTIQINGKPVHAEEGVTVLEASYGDKYARRQYDIKIPCIQYLRGVQEHDDSGLCTVEIGGELVNASRVEAKPGMEVWTNTPAALEAQRAALDAMLATHDLDCRNCVRTGSCELQNLQWKLRVTKEPECAKRKTHPVDENSIVVRDQDKCILCGRCVAACNEVQRVGAIEMKDESVAVVGASTLDGSACVSCGQCIVSCPTGALRERDDTDAIQALLGDPDKFVVIQAAPSVRAAIGEHFGYPTGSATVGKLASALRALGFDRVYDTVFGADLTIMEEANELVERLEAEGTLPMFTSCCPGWVKYCEQEFPQLIPNLSSCKSPQQMFGATIKSYIAKHEGIDPENIVVVSAMPCTAKKFEITRPSMEGAGTGLADVDFSITARELGRWLERRDVSFMSLPEGEFDSPVKEGTGAGVIFGATGGVMEAALRTAADKLSGESLEEVQYTDVRGIDGVKGAVYDIAGNKVKVAAVSGLANAHALMEKIANGEADYTFVEVMACPGGCVNGGGQPRRLATDHMVDDVRATRGNTLYGIDEASAYRKSHDNPDIKKLYKEHLGEPGGEKAHALLHTAYMDRA